MTILTCATYIIAIVFMCVMIFIGIWLFIIAIKAYNQIKYKNFILEKIYEKLDKYADNKFSFDEFKYYLNLNKDNDMQNVSASKINNIKDYEKFQ